MIKKGMMLSFITAIISGISIFSNAIFVSHTDPLIFTMLRNSVVVLFLTMILLITKDMRTLPSLTKKEWGMLILIGAIGGGIPFAMFFSGISMIGAVNGNILQKTLFIWIALLAIPILKERLSKVQSIGYCLLFVGLFVIGGTWKFVPTTGSYLVLCATMLWAIEHIIAKVALRTLSPFIVSWGRMAFGLPFLFGAIMVFGKTSLLVSSASWTMMPIMVSSLLLVGYVLVWYSALSNAPATLVSSILVFAPVVTILLTGMVLHKVVPQSQFINNLLITGGALLVAFGVLMPAKKTVVYEH